jgi:hypothetical protein
VAAHRTLLGIATRFNRKAGGGAACRGGSGVPPLSLGQKRRGRRIHFRTARAPGLAPILGAILILLACPLRIRAAPSEIRLEGSRPELVFACELSDAPLQALFADGTVISELKQLHAGVCLVISDLDPARAAVVRRLTGSGVPVIAWAALPKDEGYYLNAANGAQALAWFGKFQQWTADNRLRWAAVGLDIEPTLEDYGAAPPGRSHGLFWTFARRYFDYGRVDRGRRDYTELIRRTHAAGYRVQTYQLPFIVDERQVRTTLLERLLGIVDVRGDEEILMLYSSLTRGAGSALIWSYGPFAQGIAVGCTTGEGAPGSPTGPLTWPQFTSDLIAASHYSRLVGIYSLEGCVRQGYLARLPALDWSQPVLISPLGAAHMIHFRHAVHLALWMGAHLPYFAAILILLIAWWIRRRQARRLRSV